eukprot:14530629-Alexandrium_andersonii.AAC.2
MCIRDSLFPCPAASVGIAARPGDSGWGAWNMFAGEQEGKAACSTATQASRAVERSDTSAHRVRAHGLLSTLKAGRLAPLCSFKLLYLDGRTAPGVSPGGATALGSPGWRLRRQRPLWVGYRPPDHPDWPLARRRRQSKGWGGGSPPGEAPGLFSD